MDMAIPDAMTFLGEELEAVKSERAERLRTVAKCQRDYEQARRMLDDADVRIEYLSEMLRKAQRQAFPSGVPHGMEAGSIKAKVLEVFMETKHWLDMTALLAKMGLPDEPRLKNIYRSAAHRLTLEGKLERDQSKSGFYRYKQPEAATTPEARVGE